MNEYLTIDDLFTDSQPIYTIWSGTNRKRGYRFIKSNRHNNYLTVRTLTKRLYFLTQPNTKRFTGFYIHNIHTKSPNFCFYNIKVQHSPPNVIDANRVFFTWLHRKSIASFFWWTVALFLPCFLLDRLNLLRSFLFVMLSSFLALTCFRLSCLLSSYLSFFLVRAYLRIFSFKRAYLRLLSCKRAYLRCSLTGETLRFLLRGETLRFLLLVKI